MFVKFLRHHQGLNAHPGQVREVSDVFGRNLVAAGNAVEVNAPPAPPEAPQEGKEEPKGG